MNTWTWQVIWPSGLFGCQQELKLVCGHAVIREQRFDAHLEREWQLVTFEQRAADVLVHRVCVISVQIDQPLVEPLGRVAPPNWVLEQTNVGVQREPVHRIDLIQTVQDEVQRSRAFGARSILLETAFSYVGFRNLTVLVWRLRLVDILQF